MSIGGFTAVNQSIGVAGYEEGYGYQGIDGILGLGGIGLRLAELAHAFPMRIIYHSRNPSADAPAWAEYFPADRLDEFLAQADVLSVHVPLREETEGLVDEKMIRKLKRGSVLINTARGKVVDEAAMIRALEDGHVSLPLLCRFVTELNATISSVPLAWTYSQTNLR